VIRRPMGFSPILSARLTPHKTSLTYIGKNAIITIPVVFKGSFSIGQPVFLSFPGEPSMPPDVPVTLTSLAGEPMVKNLYPLSGSGPTVLATGTFATHAWAPDLYLAYILFLPTPNVVSYTAKGTCLIEYNTISNGVRLIDDPGTGWIGPISGVPLGPLAGTLSNSVARSIWLA
jgi:hypothetical protein